MTFHKISVLVPTRQRLDDLRTLLASYDATAGESVESELVFRVDDDDPASAELLRASGRTVLVGPRHAGYSSLPWFYRELLAIATGDVLMTGNDDMVFRTPGWPALLLAEANRYPDGVFNLGVSTHNATHFPFSTIARVAADAMGYVHDPRLYWGDVFLRDVMAAFDRAVLVPTVTIDHDWRGWRPDRTFREADQDNPARTNSLYWMTHDAVVNQAVSRVRALTAVPA
jgi:hypothetical protein